MSSSYLEVRPGVPYDRHLPLRDEPGRRDGSERMASLSNPANSPLVGESLRSALKQTAELNIRPMSESYRDGEGRDGSDFEDIVGRTPGLLRLLDLVNQVAVTNSAVLVTGETGTGKELVARAVHQRSRRCARPLVIVNCAALAPTLVEAELFGHERGAFTGATSRRPGRFELANRGTIFLDEVGELPEAIQVKLLRVLQSGEVERLGSAQTQRVDVRLIAATNRNLEKAVAAGTFRSDLYYRLHVFPIHVPPLRKRREDIPLLTTYLVEKKGKTLGKIIDCVPPEVMQRLTQYSWPGNVRELENVIERAIILSRDGVLRLHGVFDAGAPNDPDEPSAALAPRIDEARLPLRDVERAHILRVCEDCGWRIKGPESASVRLGLKPSTLYFRMRKLGIVKPS